MASLSSKFDYDVFLSHNRADKDWTRLLAARIERLKSPNAEKARDSLERVSKITEDRQQKTENKPGKKK